MDCPSHLHTHTKVLYPNDRLYLPAYGARIALTGQFENARGKPGWISAMCGALHRTWSLTSGEKQDFYLPGSEDRGTLIANTGSSPITITWESVGTMQVSHVAC